MVSSSCSIVKYVQIKFLKLTFIVKMLLVSTKHRVVQHLQILLSPRLSLLLLLHLLPLGVVGGETPPAQRAAGGLLQPGSQAGGVELVTAGQPHHLLVLLELLQADGALRLTVLSDQSPGQSLNELFGGWWWRSLREEC